MSSLKTVPNTDKGLVLRGCGDKFTKFIFAYLYKHRQNLYECKECKFNANGNNYHLYSFLVADKRIFTYQRQAMICSRYY